MIPILLLGGGGHCISSIDVIESTSLYEVVGVVDNKLKKGDMVLGKPVLGSDKDLDKLREDFEYAIVTVGQIKDPAPRVKLYKKLKTLRFRIPKIVSPRSYVSSSARIGDGTIVFHGAVVNAEVSIGENCIINSLSLCEHNVSIGSHSHVSTSAVVNGNCIVGDKSFVGSGAVLRQGVTVGNNCIISFGEKVKQSLKDNITLIDGSTFEN